MINKKLIDRRGKKISDKTLVKVTQLPRSDFSFMTIENQEDIELFNKSNKNVFSHDPNGRYEYKLYKDDEYILTRNGTSFAFEICFIENEKTPFYMDSEYDIPEMNIKRGDPVLCFGGEGYAMPVFRYPSYELEVL